MRKLTLKTDVPRGTSLAEPPDSMPIQILEPQVILRVADIHDILPLTLMWSKMTQEIFDNFIKLDKMELDKFSYAMADRLRVPHVFTQVACDGAKVVGFIHSYLQDRSYGKPNRIAFCEALYVETEYRGKSIAKKLIQSFIGWAEKQELAIEFITRYDTNLVKIWERSGFVPYSIVFRR